MFLKTGFRGKGHVWIQAWLLIAIMGGLAWLGTHFWPKDGVGESHPETRASLERNASRWADRFSTDLYQAPMAALAELGSQSAAGPARAETLAKAWLASQPNMLCVTLWYPGQRWPVRVLAHDFWSRIHELALAEAAQTRLLSWMFEKERPRAGQDTIPITFHRTHTLSMTRLVYYPNEGAEAIEVKREVGPLFAQFSETLPDQQGLSLWNPAESKLIWDAGLSPPDGLAFPPDGGPCKRISQWWFRREIANGRWFLLIGMPGPSQEMTSGVFPVWTLVGLFVWMALAGLMAYGIQWLASRPVKALADAAKELAQGQFEDPLPPSADPHLDHLVRLFNYMAGEMDRFQRIDVHEIIHDKKKTETMLRNLADGVVVTDHQDRVVILNGTAEQWFGIKDGDSAGTLVTQVIKDDALLALIRKVRTDKEVQTGEFELHVAGQRRKRVYQAHAAPLEGDDGRGTGVVTAIRDITKEKEADQIKTELVSMVAHELKSPLTSIYGFSELLLDSSRLDEKGKEYAQVILNESNRLTELINKFLDLSRLESGKTEIKKLPFDLGQLIVKVAEVHAGQAARRKIRVITQVPNNLPLASGDMDMIEQVLVNLFSNAVKYSPAHSKIGIEVKSEKEMLAVSVIDNGYGIPKEALSHIFDKFYRVSENTEMDDVEGSGLGLTLAREIIEQHGGTIRVNSRLGVGSVFTFLVPKAEIDPSWIGLEP